MTADEDDRPPLALVTEPQASRTVLRAAGWLDLATVAELEGAVRDLAPHQPVTVDLGAITFMDSSGVRAIDTLLREARRDGWTLRFAPGLHAQVADVLRMTGMMEVLPIDEEQP